MELKDLEGKLAQMVSQTEPPRPGSDECSDYLKACGMLLQIMLARSKVKTQDAENGPRIHRAAAAVIARNSQ